MKKLLISIPTLALLSSAIIAKEIQWVKVSEGCQVEKECPERKKKKEFKKKLFKHKKGHVKHHSSTKHTSQERPSR